MNRQTLLRAVRRPETGAGHIGQHSEIRCLYLWDGIHSLRAIRRAQDAVAGIVKDRTLFEVVRPISNEHCIAGLSVRFDRVLINR